MGQLSWSSCSISPLIVEGEYPFRITWEFFPKYTCLCWPPQGLIWPLVKNYWLNIFIYKVYNFHLSLSVKPSHFFQTKCSFAQMQSKGTRNQHHHHALLYPTVFQSGFLTWMVLSHKKAFRNKCRSMYLLVITMIRKANGIYEVRIRNVKHPTVPHDEKILPTMSTAPSLRNTFGVWFKLGISLCNTWAASGLSCCSVPGPLSLASLPSSLISYKLWKKRSLVFRCSCN